MAYRSVHVFKYDSRNKVRVYGVIIGLPYRPVFTLKQTMVGVQNNYYVRESSIGSR